MRRFPWAVLLIVVVLAHTADAWAEDAKSNQSPPAAGAKKSEPGRRYKAGEKVEVDWNSSWLPGEIVSSSAGGKVKVKFQSRGIDLTMTLTPEYIRRPGDMAPVKDPASKEAKDSPSKEASPKTDSPPAPTASPVTPSSPAKPASPASPAIATPPRPATPPAVEASKPAPLAEPGDPASPGGGSERFDADSGGETSESTARAADWSGVDELLVDKVEGCALEPDAMVAGGVKVKNGAVSVRPLELMNAPVRGNSRFGSAGFFEDVDEIFFAAQRPEAFVWRVDTMRGGEEKVGRLERWDLAKNKITGGATFFAETPVIDVSPDGQRALCKTRGKDGTSPERLDVWDISGAKPSCLASFEPFGDRSWPYNNIPWAAFSDPDHLLTTDHDGKLIMWEISSVKAIWSVALQAREKLALSANGKYLAFSDKTDVTLLNAKTGHVVGVLSGGISSDAQLSFKPDGTQLAQAVGGSITVWDLTTGKLLYEFTVNEGRRWGGEHISWPSEGYLLLNGSRLIDLARGIVLWNYYCEGDYGTSRGDQICYFMHNRASSDLRFCHVAIPNEKVLKVAKSLTNEKLMAVRPGLQVSLTTSLTLSPEDQRVIRETITQRLKDNGLTVVPQSPLVVSLTMKTGQTRTMNFRKFGDFNGPVTQVTATETIQSIEFKENDHLLWHATSVDGAPSIVSMQEGQSIEQAVAERAKPTATFFLGQRLPKFVARPGPDHGAYGHSTLTARGIE